PTLFDGTTPVASGQSAQDRAEQIQARYVERKAARDAGLAKVQTWERERMVLPGGTTRRTRQKVTVQYNPNGWRRDGAGGYSQEICNTLVQFDAYPHPPGKHWREQWDEDHGTQSAPYGDIEHSVPTVWKVRTADKARRFTTERGRSGRSGRGRGWFRRCRRPSGWRG
ncbi:MAG TPA: hypothetical protein VGJ54_11890, partial [Streptosporangiaceae bacterium]